MIMLKQRREHMYTLCLLFAREIMEELTSTSKAKHMCAFNISQQLFNADSGRSEQNSTGCGHSERMRYTAALVLSESSASKISHVSLPQM